MDELKNKPWEKQADEAPTSIYLPRGMVGPEERRAYYWLAKNCVTGQGTIVDAGAYLGASTHALAAGAAAGGHVSFNGGPIVHAYDYFKVIDQYVGDSIRRDFRPIALDESYLDIFEFQTAKYEELIKAYPSDFHLHKWHGDPIEILFIDVSKTVTLNSHVVGEFFSSLIPGHSIVIHQDYFHCWHPYIHISMEFFADEFELIDEFVAHQSRVWRLVKPLSEEKIARIRDYDLSAEERLGLLDQLAAKSSDFFRPMIEVVKLWQICLDKDWDAASAEMSMLRSRYDLAKANILWARQAIEVEGHITRAKGK